MTIIDYIDPLKYSNEIRIMKDKLRTLINNELDEITIRTSDRKMEKYLDHFLDMEEVTVMLNGFIRKVRFSKTTDGWVVKRIRYKHERAF